MRPNARHRRTARRFARFGNEKVRSDLTFPFRSTVDLGPNSEFSFFWSPWRCERRAPMCGCPVWLPLSLFSDVGGSWSTTFPGFSDFSSFGVSPWAPWAGYRPFRSADRPGQAFPRRPNNDPTRLVTRNGEFNSKAKVVTAPCEARLKQAGNKAPV